MKQPRCARALGIFFAALTTAQAFASPALGSTPSIRPVSRTALWPTSCSSANGRRHAPLSRTAALPPSIDAALRLAGGAAPSAVAAKASESSLSLLLGTGIDRTFNSVFTLLIAAVAVLRTATRSKSSDDDAAAPVNSAERNLQWRFLAVFWLFRAADWLQGPYFVEVYMSKVIGGVALGMDTIAKLFLTGFTTTALLGPLVGNWVDKYGRKKGSMAFALFYTAAALAVCSNNLAVLFAGRIAGGIGTSLLFSAPEAWFVGEAGRGAFSGAFLGRTFGLAYFGDSIAAMTAGQVAQASANVAGPTAPFVASTLCLGLGALIASICWAENKADRSSSEASSTKGGEEEASKSSGSGGGIRRAAEAMAADPKIMCVGAVQSLFEGAMYIFVLQWPNALRAVLSGSAAVPFGKVFSCFMASCMLGSSLFPAIANRGVRVEDSAPLMLGLAATAMASAAAFGTTGLAALAGAFFAFEACVGFYFPAIGTLRSKYLPDEHRSVIMNLFGIPLNLIVVATYLQISRLGTTGALWISAASLTCSFLAACALKFASSAESMTKASSS